MLTMIACMGAEDPCPFSLIDGLSQSGPILNAIRNENIQDIIVLVAPSYLGNVPALEKMIQSEHKNKPITIIPLSVTETLTYENAFSSLKIAIQPFQHLEKLIFLPNISHPIWHVAGMLLYFSETLKAKLLDPSTHEDIIKPEVGTFDALRLKKFQIQAPSEKFIDDIALACGLEGQHPFFKEALETAAAFAIHDTPILILGETGTGKDIFARFCHAMSHRSSAPFIPVNCAALPESLAESILFGHIRGAFTGAIQAQQGKFSCAHAGTLFLDELGELPLSIQAKLLRVIEDGLLEPLGANKSEKVNVRIIAATNRDLYEEMKAGRFREDLYYRLRVGEFCLPPLRSRKSDIILLALYFLKKINKSLSEHKRLHPKTLEMLEQYPWPGNIRDLQNVLERAVMLSHNTVLNPEDLRLEAQGLQQPLIDLPEFGSDFSLESYIANIRKSIIDKALYQSNGNQSEAARLLGITPQAVNRFVRDRELLNQN